MTTTARIPLDTSVFRASCLRAFQAEFAVALFCIRHDAVQVSAPEYNITPDWEHRADYRDRGDLMVRWRREGPLCAYEVKHRTDMFTGPSDYPYREIIVDEVANLDGKAQRPHGYFICNADLSAALFIDLVRQGDSLTPVTRHDRRYNQPLAFYMMPTKDTRAVRLSE